MTHILAPERTESTHCDRLVGQYSYVMMSPDRRADPAEPWGRGAGAVRPAGAVDLFASSSRILVLLPLRARSKKASKKDTLDMQDNPVFESEVG